jgi:plastocyanin
VQVASDAENLHQRQRPFEARDFSDKSEKEKRMSSKLMWVLISSAAAIFMTAMLAGAPSLSANPQQATTAEVKIDNFSFGPATITVAPGTTVTWVNHDDIPHTVVSTDSVFKSKVLDTDEKFSYTFTKAGNYPYFCSIHPKMTATVVVK